MPEEGWVGGGCGWRVCASGGRGGGYVEERRCQQWREGSGAKVRVDEGEGDGRRDGGDNLVSLEDRCEAARLPRCLRNAA